MSYTKEAIVEPTTAVQSSTQPQMKEEMVVDPYQSSRRMSQIISKTAPLGGQKDISSEQVKVVGEEAQTLPEETVTLSPQMAALARKEQRFRQREQSVKDRESALEARNAKIAKLEAMEAKLAAKDYSGIEELVKYDEYTNYLIEKETSLSPEQLAVKKLSDEVEALKASQKDDVTKRFDAAVNERRKAVNELVQSNPEYSIIKRAKAEEAVVHHILDTWEHDNTELSVEEAAKELKQVLTEKRAQWVALTEEEQKQNTETQAEELPGQKKQLPPLKPQIKTLTNNMAVTGEISRPLKSLSGMSDRERYAEARRRAEEKLQKGIR